MFQIILFFSLCIEFLLQTRILWKGEIFYVLEISRGLKRPNILEFLEFFFQTYSLCLL